MSDNALLFGVIALLSGVVVARLILDYLRGCKEYERTEEQERKGQ